MNEMPNGFFSKFTCLSGNQLKIFALLSMTCDHIALLLFPQYKILRIIGRFSFPIFAYMVAEGCRYTRNRGKHLLHLVFAALLCQSVYYFAMDSLFQCIFVTFALSVLLIYALDFLRKKKTFLSLVTAVGAVAAVFLCCLVFPDLLGASTDYAIDYGLWGVLFPVFLYFTPPSARLPMTALLLIPLALEYGEVQWYAYGALLPLALYNGKKGQWKMKYLFYFYYPLHLVAIYGIRFLLYRL